MIELELIRTIVNGASTYAFNALVLPVAVFSAFFYFFGFIGIAQRKKDYNRKKVGKLPNVTIQIPTYNEPVAIRCAESCLGMDYPKDRYEIIIGDDSSDKEVSALIDSFAKKHKRLKVVRRSSNKGFKAGNLNNMLKHSNGDIIVVFDSDFVVQPDFLKRIAAPFEDKNVACAQAKWSYANMEQSPTSKFASTVLMVYHNILARLNQRAGVALLFGSGEAVRKNVLQELGGWQEGSVTEDVEFSVRALSKGYRNVYLHDLSVDGEVPYNAKSLRVQQSRWAYGNTKTFLEHRKSILFGRFSPIQKALMTFTMLGYLSSFFLVAFMFSGAVSFMTGTPGTVDAQRLAADIFTNFLFTSGFTFAGVVALWKENRLRHIFVVFFTALTVGILVSLSVCHGILKVLGRRHMHWTIITKRGNMDFLPADYGLTVKAR